jgi:uncharacterized lipoprotein YajG
MKKLVIFTAGLLLLAACKQERTDTNATIGNTTTVQTSTHTETVTTPTVDTAATAEVKHEAKEAVKDAKAAANDAAYKTGTAMETAGKEIQKKTKKH